MAEIYLPAGVEKRVLYPGKGDIPLFISGTKVLHIFCHKIFLQSRLVHATISVGIQPVQR